MKTTMRLPALKKKRCGETVEKYSSKVGPLGGVLKLVRNENDAWMSAELTIWKMRLYTQVVVKSGRGLSSRYGPHVKLKYKVGVKHY
ncbi:MAG: hypothetical protein SVV03_02530 [Candidatus Nanohaloarchaea archaeon]|nr:hypothetical protein [Candidatus Nanohaloarchaea archaeon]